PAMSDQLKSDTQQIGVAHGTPSGASRAGSQLPPEIHNAGASGTSLTPYRGNAVDAHRPRATFAQQRDVLSALAPAAARRKGVSMTLTKFGKPVHELTAEECRNAAALDQAKSEFYEHLALHTPRGKTVGTRFTDDELNQLFAQFKKDHYA